jgi:hypothetical protein
MIAVERQRLPAGAFEACLLATAVMELLALNFENILA